MELNSKEQWQQVLDSADTFLFDCDGVLWTGASTAVSGAAEIIKFLRSQGKAVYFVSNNSTKSREGYLKKFTMLGIEAYEHEIFCTAFIAASYLKNVLNFRKKVYLLGSQGFTHELDLVDIPYTGTGPDPMPEEFNIPELMKMQLDPEVGGVVVGFDHHISFMKLIKACSYLCNPDCIFIGTNEDSFLPMCPGDKIVIPGTGCLVNQVAFGAGRKPIVVGKPNEPIFQVIKQSTNLDPARTLMIGDRVSTDIVFGLRNGMQTLLVFTGVASRSDLASLGEEEKPHYYADSVTGILSCRP